MDTVPNWCQNILTILGSIEDLEEMKKHGKDGRFTLESYYPFETEDGEWDYDWCVNNWGTKWDVSGTTDMRIRPCVAKVTPRGARELTPGEYFKRITRNNQGEVRPNKKKGEIQAGKITLIFDTAWAPPTEGLFEISTRWYTLSFGLVYVECGMEFAGTIKMHSGDVFFLEYGEVDEYLERYADVFAYTF